MMILSFEKQIKHKSVNYCRSKCCDITVKSKHLRNFRSHVMAINSHREDPFDKKIFREIRHVEPKYILSRSHEVFAVHVWLDN